MALRGALLLAVVGLVMLAPARSRITWPLGEATSNTPGWVTLPWGPPTSWDDVTKQYKCKAEMDKVLRPLQVDCQSPAAQAQGAEVPCSWRVALIGLHMGPYANQAWTKATASLLKSYCKRWQFCDAHLLVDHSFEEGFQWRDRALSWLKVLAIRHVLKEGKYDWYMWFDADAAIIDHSIDIRFALWAGGGTSKMVHVSRDVWGVQANAGVLAIRNGTESLAFLDEWWDSAKKDAANQHFIRHHPWDQGVLNALIKKYAKEPHVFQVYPECWFFGHPWAYLDRPFIAHMCGMHGYQQKFTEREKYFQFWDEINLLPDNFDSTPAYNANLTLFQRAFEVAASAPLIWRRRLGRSLRAARVLLS